jgi:transposase InsO family protein
MCDILEVTRSGFYASIDRPVSARQIRQEQLVEKIRRSHADSNQLYGSPNITADLKESGERVTRKTVARLMKQEGIRSKVARKFRPCTTDSRHRCPVSPNVLDRDFEAKLPNQKWCVDITYVPTDQGTLYLAAVIDLCSRRIVGWSMADHMRASLCIDALDMALLHRRPSEGLIHHSDRGVQYACEDYQARLETNGIECSMSRVGNCYDNAVMESFWGSYKQEELYQQPNGRFASFAQARTKSFQYIEIFYNRKRRHSSIGYQSPEQFEASLN